MIERDPEAWRAHAGPPYPVCWHREAWLRDDHGRISAGDAIDALVAALVEAARWNHGEGLARPRSRRPQPRAKIQLLKLQMGPNK